MNEEIFSASINQFFNSGEPQDQTKPEKITLSRHSKKVSKVAEGFIQSKVKGFFLIIYIRGLGRGLSELHLLVKIARVA